MHASRSFVIAFTLSFLGLTACSHPGAPEQSLSPDRGKESLDVDGQHYDCGDPDPDTGALTCTDDSGQTVICTASEEDYSCSALDDPGSPDAGVMPPLPSTDGGAPMPPMPSTDGGVAPGAHDHEMHAGGSGTCMPRDSYPKGSEGSSKLQVEPTTEEPASSDIGAFRVVCEYSHMSQDDPIVFPGQPCKAHLHTFFGNTGASASSTYDSLRHTGNSTCTGGTANKTAYWIPTMMNDGVPVVPTSAIFYYKAGYSIPNASGMIQKIPAGLRIIAGNSMATGPESELHAYWGCENNYKGHFAEIVDCDVGDSLQMTVVFPQCWNGKDLDSPDHKSHMAYAGEGGCPATHPVILPEISQNVFWERTPDLDISKLRLSSDHYDASMPGGYSAHGDWFEAWEPNVRDSFVENCINQGVDCHAHLLGDGRELY